MMNSVRCGLILCGIATAPLSAQTSSIGARARQGRDETAPAATRESALNTRNVTYDNLAWSASPPPAPRTYRPGDLITVIVRERRQWKADADLETKNEFDVKSTLNAFPKWVDHGLGASDFRRGKPNVDYSYDQELKKEGDAQRKDELTTRMSARIIDVKPNGQLVLEGRSKVIHDDEESEITIIGTCRKEDVTADNTVLSTQIADKEVVIRNKGALKRASSRGWIPRLIDFVNPF